MRIDLYNSAATELASEQASQRVSTENASKSGGPQGEDRTTLSDAASVDSLVSKALSSPEVRQDKVDSLKQAVNSGQYDLDPAKIAGAMVDHQA
jgi:flagellar biosynthesis anti-sigma factor FlgM